MQHTAAFAANSLENKGFKQVHNFLDTWRAGSQASLVTGAAPSHPLLLLGHLSSCHPEEWQPGVNKHNFSPTAGKSGYAEMQHTAAYAANSLENRASSIVRTIERPIETNGWHTSRHKKFCWLLCAHRLFWDRLFFLEGCHNRKTRKPPTRHDTGPPRIHVREGTQARTYWTRCHSCAHARKKRARSSSRQVAAKCTILHHEATLTLKLAKQSKPIVGFQVWKLAQLANARRRCARRDICAHILNAHMRAKKNARS